MSVMDGRYERLLLDIKSDYRPQREWSEGRGFFLIVGHFLVGVAAGSWLLGLWFDDSLSLIIGYGLAILGGLAHLFNLARPGRVLYMMTRVATSWVSRGFWGLSFFLAGGGLLLPAKLWPGLFWGPASAAVETGLWLSVLGAIILIAYMGFVYTASKGIAFWNSTLHPVLYVAYAARGGAAVLLLSMALGGASGASGDSLLGIWVGATALVALLWVLEIQGALASRDASAAKSVQAILAGRLSVAFYAGTLAVGLVVPAVLIAGIVAPLSPMVLLAIAITSVIGDFFMKFSSIKAGVYAPLRLPHPARTP